MDCLSIRGGIRLHGSVTASGSKNAALPIMAASILSSGRVTLSRVPDVVDVNTLALLLGYLGVEVKRTADLRVHVETVDPTPTQADYDLVRRMRASFCVLGPLVARRGRAVVSLPGGCNIGSRPVDLHLSGLAKLGARIRIEHGYVVAEARRLRGAEIDLRGPFGPTVTGTANVMSAATLARGTTVIRGAAREPEIVDLGRFLISMGARIDGLGSDNLEIHGVDELGSTKYQVIPDRIEAGTLLIAGAITGGNVNVAGVVAEHLATVLATLTDAGHDVLLSQGAIGVQGRERSRPIHVTARPYPGLPTDLQSQLTAMASLAGGESRISDAVFPDRFMQVAELNRLGAQIERHGSTAVVRGVNRLLGATVMASDLRASACLVLAGLEAKQETIVRRIYHLDRGYERLEEKLVRLGADITRQRDEGMRLPTENSTVAAVRSHT